MVKTEHICLLNRIKCYNHNGRVGGIPSGNIETRQNQNMTGAVPKNKIMKYGEKQGGNIIFGLSALAN